MKRLALLFSCSAALMCAADLAGVHTVYVLKMGKGLDQYLASRLAAEHVFQIVTDPKLADTVLTDQVGEALQLQLEEISPTPEPPKAAPEKKKKPAGHSTDQPNAAAPEKKREPKAEKPAVPAAAAKDPDEIF